MDETSKPVHNGLSIRLIPAKDNPTSHPARPWIWQLTHVRDGLIATSPAYATRFECEIHYRVFLCNFNNAFLITDIDLTVGKRGADQANLPMVESYYNSLYDQVVATWGLPRPKFGLVKDEDV